MASIAGSTRPSIQAPLLTTTPLQRSLNHTVNPNPNPRYQQWERPFVSVATTASDNQWEPHSLINDLRACVEASTVTLEIES